jgi:hydrophobic/amphiphilic exporter-1 (mainly G- bacteria), HAE1 family
MKKLVRFAVDNPVSIWMLTLAIGLLGVISFSRLGTDLFPELDTPRLFIKISAGENSPGEIETDYVENIEALAVRQNGVVSVYSDITVGGATITVEYDYGRDMDEAFLDLQKNIVTFEQNSDADEISISRFDPNSSPVIEAAFVSENNQNMAELREIAEKQIVNELVRLDGIADVQLTGDIEYQVIISANPAILKINGLTSNDIINAIDSYNSNVSGGYIEESGQQYIIKGTGIIEKPEDLLDLVVGYRSGNNSSTSSDGSEDETPILLSEVASVSIGTSDPKNIVSLNGVRCLGISLYKETGYNTVKAVETITREFSEIEKRLPGIRLVIISNQGEVISSAVNEVQSGALFGIVLAVIVLFIFLRRIGLTLVVSIAIPVSVIATFNLMYFNNLTLNIMTLGGLALGAGMLVDNAIVAVENIFRYLEEGKGIRQAAIDGISEVGGALVASTLTTIVVFLPVVYLHGASGELFKDEAWTVAFSLLSSLFVAILLIPVMIQYFFPGKSLLANQRTKKQNHSGALSFKWYGKYLQQILERRNAVLLITILFLVLSGWLFTRIGSEFMPAYDSNELTLKIKLPPGTTLEKTASTAHNIGNIVTQMTGDQAQCIYISVGSDTENTTDTGGDNTGTLKLMLKKGATIDLSRLTGKLELFFEKVPGLEVEYHKEGSGLTNILNSDDAPFEVQITGDDLDLLTRLTKEVKTTLAREKELMITYTSFEEETPKIAIKVDRYRAGIYNVDVSTIVTQVTRFLQGDDAGSMDLNGKLTDIILKMPEVTISELNNLQITNNSKQYLLSELADIVPGSSPADIERVNQRRIGRIQGYPLGDKPFSDLVQDVQASLSKINVPDGFRIRIAGEELQRKDSFKSLMFALILSIILVYMIMASQFESLIHPFTILLSLPLAGAGVVLLFFITGNNFNIMALIGVVMLGGIAVNNSILLVDAINHNIRAGLDRRSAIVAAGQQRIRPILITSTTTILALLPLTFGFGESASLRTPMALAVIGGLFTSTLLTLIVIPCLYDLFDRLRPTRKVEPANLDL